MRRHPKSHYLDGTEPDPVDFLMQVVVRPHPDSATRGDIVITELESSVDRWAGVWRLDTGQWDGEWPRVTQLGSRFGSRAELVDWAVAQDAASSWIFDEEASVFVPLA
jgi:hypothetical protein